MGRGPWLGAIKVVVLAIGSGGPGWASKWHPVGLTTGHSDSLDDWPEGEGMDFENKTGVQFLDPEKIQVSESKLVEGLRG